MQLNNPSWPEVRHLFRNFPPQIAQIRVQTLLSKLNFMKSSSVCNTDAMTKALLEPLGVGSRTGISKWFASNHFRQRQ